MVEKVEDMDRSVIFMKRENNPKYEEQMVSPTTGPLEDSGHRRLYLTGAVRDRQYGKGRCDLLPAAALLRLSKHYEAGAIKYTDRNWEKGIPISDMIDSGLRHILKYLDGWDDEDHLAAAAWNILGAMWMEEKKPELQNIPSRLTRIEEVKND